MHSIYLIPAASLGTVLAIIAIVTAVIIGALYFWGRKMQKKQEIAQEQIQNMKQVVSILVIDKKKLKPSESGLPESALAQIPWFARRAKMPIVKAKIGPQIASLVADQKVFDMIPVKKECKVALSGIYISEIKSVRGGKVLEPEPKKSFWKRLLKK